MSETTLMTATSHALQCLELRQLICHEQIGSNDKRSLYRLSQTCKSFMEPALDELWYKLDNFSPLLFCMPEDLYEEHVELRDTRQEIVTLSFRRSMQPSDWKSFEAAAARVRVLGSPRRWEYRFYQFDSNIFKSLACASQGRARLLPRLQQLTWDTRSDDIYPYIFLFLTPTITHLTLCISTGNIASDRMRFSVLGSLVSQCPSMRSLELSARRSSLEDSHSWTDLFSGQASSADISTLTDVIAQLPVLTTLDLFACQTTKLLLSSSVMGFHALQHLIMSDCSIDSCLYVLKRMSCSPLSSLNLYVKVPHPSNESRWTDLFSNLQKSISRDSLTIANFSILGSHLPIPLSFQSISPLLHFQNISKFCCDGKSNLDLGDDDVIRIAKAWPRLKTFVIHPWKLSKPRLTLHALTTLAMHCPELEFLFISIDATTVVDYEDKQPGKGRFDSRLRHLSVDHSPIDDPGRVASFIADIFPNVTKVSVACESRAVNRQKWKEVERMLPVLAASRRQEVTHKS
ncbi:hypothetical protein F5887DRAFT_947356 [Amanita rubescens]|nr:hypothetical protein F5887DRAFT_947356 [Amanita rubescens]